MLPSSAIRNGSKSILIQNDSRELNITTEDAKNWIETNIYQNEPKNFNLLRSKYLGKLGILTGGVINEGGGKEEEGKEIDKDGEEEDKLKIEKSYCSGEYMINFFQKSDDQVRKNYLDKLIRNNILKTSPSKKQQSCKV